MSAPGAELVLAALRESRRYRSVDESVLQRVASEALEIEKGKVKAAIARARRKLHQAHGAYAGEPVRWDKWLARLDEAPDDEARRATLREVLARHASSREREPHVEMFWAEIASRVPAPKRVLDLACGINPLSRPWCTWASDVEHVGVDIDRDMLGFVGKVLDRMGIAHREMVGDLVAEVPAIEADVAFVLKAYQCLERQRTGAGLSVLREARSPLLVVSFPTMSLGGRGKGMEFSYSAEFESLAARERWSFESFGIPGERLYLVRK